MEWYHYLIGYFLGLALTYVVVYAVGRGTAKRHRQIIALYLGVIWIVVLPAIIVLFLWDRLNQQIYKG